MSCSERSPTLLMAIPNPPPRTRELNGVTRLSASPRMEEPTREMLALALEPKLSIAAEDCLRPVLSFVGSAPIRRVSSLVVANGLPSFVVVGQVALHRKNQEPLGVIQFFCLATKVRRSFNATGKLVTFCGIWSGFFLISFLRSSNSSSESLSRLGSFSSAKAL